jgi:hypothetical protein
MACINCQSIVSTVMLVAAATGTQSWQENMHACIEWFLAVAGSVEV